MSRHLGKLNKDVVRLLCVTIDSRTDALPVQTNRNSIHNTFSFFADFNTLSIWKWKCEICERYTKNGSGKINFLLLELVPIVMVVIKNTYKWINWHYFLLSECSAFEKNS